MGMIYPQLGLEKNWGLDDSTAATELNADKSRPFRSMRLVVQRRHIDFSQVCESAKKKPPPVPVKTAVLNPGSSGGSREVWVV